VEETGRIQLWFVLDSASHIEVSGELAWIDDTKRSGGLKFTRPSKQARQQLREWLSQQRQASEPASSAASSPPSNPPAPMPTAQSEPRADHLSHECEFERELHTLPHSDPAPLESLLDTILTSLQTAHPEDLFAHPAPASDEIQAQPPASEIEASGLVEKLAQDHASAMSSAAAPSPIPEPVRASTPAALPAPSPARKPAVRRNAPVRSAPVEQASSPASRELSASSTARSRAEKSTDVKYVQFRMAVDRVSGMLNTLRHAISADDSDWPLTAIPELPPVIASVPLVTAAPGAASAPVNPPVVAPAIVPKAVPSLAAKVAPVVPLKIKPVRAPAIKPAIASVPPARKLATAAPAPKIEPETQPEIDVRPWSAGAPWRATEPPRPPAWPTKLVSRANELASKSLKGIAPRLSRAEDAVTSAWIKTGKGARAAVAALAASTASFLHASQDNIAPIFKRTRLAAVAAATKALHIARSASALALAKARPVSRSAVAIRPAAIPPATRSPQPATSIFAAPSARPAIHVPQTNLFHASREKLATASTELKRASSRALCTMIPGEPSRGEIGAMLAITLLLIAGLAAFNYRDKFEFPAASFASDANRNLAAAEPSPEAVPTPRKSSSRVAKVRRAAAPARTATARIAPAQTQPQAMPTPSTREMAYALAYLSGKSGQRDPATAAQWLWAASRKGDTGASIVLADLYVRGDGVPQNCRQARVLLLAASKKGNEQATQKLQQPEVTTCGNPTP
jgi:hypothetical protein